MLNAWSYLCGATATDQWVINPVDQRNLYIPKLISFSYLTTSCTITPEQSFTRADDRFGFVRL